MSNKKVVDNKNKDTRRAGRKNLLNRELIDTIVKVISAGLTITRACQAGNISISVFYLWKARGEKEQAEGRRTIYVELLEALKNAEQAYKDWHLDNIRKHGQVDWRASAWTLERRYPAEFGRVDRLSALVEDSREGTVNAKVIVKDDWGASENGDKS